MYRLIKMSLFMMVLFAATTPSHALDIKIELMVKEFSGKNLNVRRGPGTKYRVLRTIHSGTRGMEILKQTGKWVKISWSKHKGWVNEKYLENVYNIDGAAEYKVSTTKSPLNMRHGPSYKQRRLRALPRGTRDISILALEKVGKTYWARISHKGKVGWVNTKYLAVATAKRRTKKSAKLSDKKYSVKKAIPAKKIVAKKKVANSSYAVRKGDTLFGVMRKTKVDWKIIAGLNRMKSPYDLRSGQTLKLD